MDNSASGAVYKGLAQGFNATGAYLYATNFHAGTVDVFDQNFNPVHIPGAFTDTGIPAGYAPFGIQTINGNLYVTYAQQDADKRGRRRRARAMGSSTSSTPRATCSSGSPARGSSTPPGGWRGPRSRASASSTTPCSSATSATASINAFDFDTGQFLGKVDDSNGTPITIPGLWALSFGVRRHADLGHHAVLHGRDQRRAARPLRLADAQPLDGPRPPAPTMLDPNLTVTTVVTGLDQPTNMTFLGPNDFFVLEKASGKVQHVVNGLAAPSVRHPVGSRTCRSTTPPSAGSWGSPSSPTSPPTTASISTGRRAARARSPAWQVGNPTAFPPGTTRRSGTGSTASSGIPRRRR